MQTSSFTLLLSKQSLNAVRVQSRENGRRIVLQARGYAAPAKPGASGGASKLDADLWKAYNTGLRKHIFSGNKLDPKTQAFFTAPVGTMGIAAGANIPKEITNFGIFNVGDTLLDINSPVFTPGNGGSYIDRQSRYLSAVQLVCYIVHHSLIALISHRKKTQTQVPGCASKVLTKSKPNFKPRWTS